MYYREGGVIWEVLELKICEEAWYEFLLAAKVLYMTNREATIYDVFNHMRVEYNGGHNNYGEHWRDDECSIAEIGSGCTTDAA